MIKLVVFDWNGTLLADVPSVVAATNVELEIINHRPLTIAEYREHFEVPVNNLYINLGIDPEVISTHAEAMVTTFHAEYEPRVAKARTRAGARQLLAELTRQKIDRIILSNHTLEGIYLQLTRLKLNDYFSTVLANDAIDHARTKGKEERLHIYLQEHKVDPSQVVIIGDTIEEVAIGKHLGLHTVAIRHGYQSSARLRRAQPDYTINRLPELLDVLTKLNKEGAN